jgi:hypothetical protein
VVASLRGHAVTGTSDGHVRGQEGGVVRRCKPTIGGDG